MTTCWMYAEVPEAGETLPSGGTPVPEPIEPPVHPAITKIAVSPTGESPLAIRIRFSMCTILSWRGTSCQVKFHGGGAVFARTFGRITATGAYSLALGLRVGRTVAAATRRLNRQSVPGPERQARLCSDARLASITRAGVPSARAGLSALRTRWLQFMAICQQRCLPGAFGKLDRADQTVAAAVPARTAGAFRDFVARDAQRKLAFDRFDRRVERIGHMAVDGIDAVGVRTSARAAAVGFVEGPRSSVGPRSAKPHVAHRAAATGRHALGNRACQRLQNDLGVAHAGLDVAARDGCGTARIEQGAFGHAHLDRTKATFVHRNRRVGDGPQRIIDARKRDAEHGVERKAALCGGSGVVEQCAAVAQLQPQCNRDARLPPAIFEIVRRVENTVADLTKRSPHRALAAVKRAGDRLVERFRAVAVHELEQAPFSGVVAGDLCPEIPAASIGRSRIRAKKRDRLGNDSI